MADANSTFTITFKTIADATGITAMREGLQSIQNSVQSTANVINTSFAAFGLSLGINELNQLGRTALEVGENVAQWQYQMLRGKDGSQELVSSLGPLNEELEKTTGTTQITSRAIEQLFSRAGLGGDQIKQATRGVIEFAASSAGTIEPLTLASLLAKRFGGSANETNISLQRLGIRAKDTAGIIQEMLTRGGNSAEIMLKASGGMKEFEVSTEHARIALGELVNVVRIPFLTTFTESIADADGHLKALSNATNGWAQTLYVSSATLADSIANVFHRAGFVASDTVLKARALSDELGMFVEQVIASVTRIVDSFVDKVINALATVGKAAANFSNVFSPIKIDATQIDAGADALKKAYHNLYGGIEEEMKKDSVSLQDDLDETNKKIRDAMVAETVEALKKPGALSDEFREQQIKKFQDFVNRLNSISKDAKAGSGVAPPGFDTKANADAIAAAKERLTGVEQRYRLELEEVDVLEKQGAVSVQQADQLRVAAAQNYLRELQAIIAQLEKLRNAQPQGSKEWELLTREIDQARLAAVKAEDQMANASVFGKIRAQLTQLKNDWSDVGKQIGQFMVTTMNTMASGITNAIMGLINHTKTLKQAFAEMASSIVQDLIQMIVKMILASTIMRLLQALFKTDSTSQASGDAASLASQWAPAAISASIATEGSAAAIGMAAWLAAVGIGAAGGAATSGRGFATGGFTGGMEGQPAGIVHGQEFVFSAPATQRVGVQNLEALHVAALTRPYQGGGFVGAGAGSSRSLRPTSGGGDQYITIHHDFSRALHDHLNSPSGQRSLVKALHGVRTKV